MTRHFSPAMLFLIGSLVLGSSVYAADNKPERQITVQGRGKITAPPDIALLWIQVTEESSKVDIATQEVRRSMDAVMKAVKSQGIADKDVQTQSYQVMPKMEWRNGRSNRIGFIVTNRVEVKVRDLKKAGHLLAAVTEAGANEVSGPQFGFDNPEEMQRKALKAAVADAKAKAEIMAQAAGASLGEALMINETGSYQPPMPHMYALKSQMAAAAPAPDQISAGEDNVEANVTVSFALN